MYLRFAKLAGRELWNDELIQLQNTIGPFQSALQRISRGELTYFPGDYLITYPFVQIFHFNKWGVNIPHILAAILGYYLLYLICRRSFKTIWGLVIAFAVFTFNAELIFHAFEFRPYAVLPTLSLASFYFSGKLVNDYSFLNRFNKCLIGLFFLFTAFYHAYGILIVVFPMTYFLLTRENYSHLKRIFGEMKYFLLIVGFSSVVIYLWYGTKNVAIGQLYPQLQHLNTFQFIPHPIENPIGFLKGIVGNLLGDKRLYILLAGPCVSFVMSPHRLKQMFFLLILIIIPLLLILIVDLQKQYWFVQRQFVWIIPLFALFIAWSWESIIIQWRMTTRTEKLC